MSRCVGRALGDVGTCHPTLVHSLSCGSYSSAATCSVLPSRSESLYSFLVSEEPSEDVEGPNETAGDVEEPAKEQESGGDKDQSKWTGKIL